MPGLEDLYREIILDHYRSPRNRGELESPPAIRSDGFNPLCGDEIAVYLDVSDDGVVSDVKIGGQGCSISQASASMMSAAIKGKSTAQARKLIRSFKEMMSIHESGLGGQDLDSDAPSVGADDAEDADTDMGDLEAMRGVVKFPVRIKCATLSWNALAQGLDEAEA